MRIVLSLIIISAVILITGCVSTQVRSYSDVNYANRMVKSIAVLAISKDVGLSESIETALGKSFTDKGVRFVRSTDILPPTREYDADEVKSALLSQGIDSLLIVEITDSGQSSEIVGYQSYGQAYGSASGSAYRIGNNTYANISGSSSSNSTSFAIKRRSRNTASTSQLFDVSTNDIIWKAQTETEAGGKLFMSDDSTGSNLANGIIDELVAKGHLAVKQ